MDGPATGGLAHLFECSPFDLRLIGLLEAVLCPSRSVPGLALAVDFFLMHALEIREPVVGDPRDRQVCCVHGSFEQYLALQRGSSPVVPLVGSRLLDENVLPPAAVGFPPPKPSSSLSSCVLTYPSHVQGANLEHVGLWL